MDYYWIIIASALHRAAGLTISNILPWCILQKLCILTFCFFDNPYSFKPSTIESPRIITFFLGSLFLSALFLFTFCGGSVCLMVCRTVSSISSYCFSWSCSFCFWFSEGSFAVFTLSLLAEMLPKSLSIIICFLCSSCNKNVPLISSSTIFSSSAFLW